MKRIKAINSTLSLGVTIFELVIAFHFLATLFRKEGSLAFEAAGNIFLPKYGSNTIFEIDGIEAPITFLFIVLAFMLFSFVLITFGPKMVRKQERKILIDCEY